MRIDPEEETKKLIRNIIDGEIADIKKNWPFYYGGPNGRTYPLHYHLFHNYRWYRKLSGGLWQLFQIEKNYFTWRKMNRKFESSSLIKTEAWPTIGGEG